MLDQDNNFYLTSLSILMTCLLDSVQLIQGEVTFDHFWELKGCIPLKDILKFFN